MNFSEKPWFSKRVFMHTANKLFINFSYFKEYKKKVKKVIQNNTHNLTSNNRIKIFEFQEDLVRIREELRWRLEKSEYFEVSERSPYYSHHLILNLSILCYLEQSTFFLYDVKTTIIHLIKKYLFFYSRRTTEKFDPLYYIPNLDKEKSFQEFYLTLKWFYNKETKKYYPPKLLKQIKEYEDKVLSKEPDYNWKNKYYFPRLR